ncbi:MAG: DNA mismatch repair endonuclease MutL [Faecalibacterium sp.]|nr:DNA mismatch repair endonuclease MutL [Faecalibacterium sp.]
MAVIHVLDKHTAELIAAGEVVERPASVVKELLENAIDAGATQITVSIESGGVKLIEISDNGSGIEAEYITTAFIRHATSKIRTAEDLEQIHTLGFRGEALASIASVSRVEVLTKTELDEFACQYRIEGGEELGMQPGARGVGTTIRVRDLFYNTPARMKFLKKDASEGTFVADIVGHVAISHPEISFKFVREGKLQYTTAGDGKLKSAAYSVLGREFSRDLLEVDDTNGLYRVHGLVTPPKSCRASRSMQHFYINGRYVKNRTMMAAMETAYKGTTMQGKFPGGILMLEMPADLVDVNVHPAKTEVRFARENDVFDVVYHGVKLALALPGSGERRFQFENETNEIPNKNDGKRVCFTSKVAAVEPVLMPEAAPETPAVVTVPKAAPVVSVPAAPKGPAEQDILELPVKAKTAVTVFQPAQPLPRKITMQSPGSFAAASENERLLDIRPDEMPVLQPKAAEPMPQIEAETEQPAAEKPVDEPAAKPVYVDDTAQTMLWEKEEIEPLQYVGEVFKTYIITQRGEEMCLIDKHAAHERILYEKIAADYGAVGSQQLLVPVTVELSAEEKQALLDNTELLENVGLEVDDFGGRTVLIRAVPCDVQAKDVADLAVELAQKLAVGGKDAINEHTEWVMHSIACRAAIKAGDRTQPQQLLHLAEQILSGKIPPFCPHGRPCVLKLTRKELEKQFGRIV